MTECIMLLLTSSFLIELSTVVVSRVGIVWWLSWLSIVHVHVDLLLSITFWLQDSFRLVLWFDEIDMEELDLMFFMWLLLWWCRWSLLNLLFFEQILSRDDLGDGFEFNEFNWITVSSVNGSDLVRWCIGCIVKHVDEIKLAAVWPRVPLLTLLLFMLVDTAGRIFEVLLCVVVAMGNDKARWWLTDGAAAKIRKKNSKILWWRKI